MLRLDTFCRHAISGKPESKGASVTIHTAYSESWDNEDRVGDNAVSLTMGDVDRILAVTCRSYPVTLLMNIPWVVLHFPLYETSKQLLAPQHHGDEGPAVQIVAGGIAGGVAAALVNPSNVSQQAELLWK